MKPLTDAEATKCYTAESEGKVIDLVMEIFDDNTRALPHLSQMRIARNIVELVNCRRYDAMKNAEIKS